MIDDLKPYPAYKDSGVEWIGKIPKHWSISRSKWLFSARKDLALPGDVQLSATQAYGVIPQSEFEEKVGRKVVRLSMHFEKRRHVEKDDFVISMRSFQGGLERAWASGAIRSSYVILKPVDSVKVDYFTYLFKSQGYIRALQSTAEFIRDGQDLNFGNFSRVDLPLVPLDEQSAISRFLDHADRLIKKYIRAKQKLIKLLEEQKQAIIHRAVTRGLDPHVKLKPSGVEWLGEVPEGWTLVPLKFASRTIQNGSTPHTANESFYEGGTIPWFGPSSIGTNIMAGRPVRYLAPAAFISGNARLIQGPAILLVVIGATAGRMALLSEDGATNQQITAYQLKTDVVEPDFAVGQLRLSTDWLRSTASTATIPILDSGTVSHLMLALPTCQLQRQIMSKLMEVLGPLGIAVANGLTELSLLREYRTRLIADVVTGKLDVRDAAASLPDVLEETEQAADLNETADEELDGAESGEAEEAEA